MADVSCRFSRSLVPIFHFVVVLQVVAGCCLSFLCAPHCARRARHQVPTAAKNNPFLPQRRVLARYLPLSTALWHLGHRSWMPSFPNTTSSFSVPERCERSTAREAPRMVRARFRSRGRGVFNDWRLGGGWFCRPSNPPLALSPRSLSQTPAVLQRRRESGQERIGSLLRSHVQIRGRLQRIQRRGFLFSAAR